MGVRLKWSPVGGLSRDHFPLARKDWTGPERGEAIIRADGSIRGIRAVFTRPDGSKRMAEVMYLKASRKHRFYSIPTPDALKGDAK